MSTDRGKIVNIARAKQVKDFTGLLFGNITPTDIDGLIEYHGKGYVLIELKLGDAVLPFGQRLALERLTDDLHTAHKPTLCIISRHEIYNPQNEIDVANSTVEEYRFKGKWKIPQSSLAVKDIIISFLDKCFGDNWR